MRVVLATTNPGKLREFQRPAGAAWIRGRCRNRTYTRRERRRDGADVHRERDSQSASRRARCGAAGDRRRFRHRSRRVARRSWRVLGALRGRGRQRRGESAKLRARAARAYRRRIAPHAISVRSRTFAGTPIPRRCSLRRAGKVASSMRLAARAGSAMTRFSRSRSCGLTAAELSAEEKNRLSHRGKALRLLVDQLRVCRASEQLDHVA